MNPLPLLLAAIFLSLGSPASAQSDQRDVGPQFKTVLAVARLHADCADRQIVSTTNIQRPCVVPASLAYMMQQEIADAFSIGVRADEFVGGYRDGLTRYLIEQKVRPDVDRSFSAKQRQQAELALNILDAYWDCIGREIRLADDGELATDAALDRLVEVSSQRCSEYRHRAMMRIAPATPDFADFDPVRDGGLPNAGVAEVLHAIQDFAVAYETGLRGYRHKRMIKMILVPVPIEIPSSRPQ